MAVLKQSSSSFRKYLVWCGVCEDTSSAIQVYWICKSVWYKSFWKVIKYKFVFSDFANNRIYTTKPM